MEEDYERKKGEGVHAFRSSSKILARNKTQWPRQSGCCFLWLATHQKTCWEILCNISVPCHSTFWLPHRSDDWPGMKFDCNNSTSFIRSAVYMRNADRACIAIQIIFFCGTLERIRHSPRWKNRQSGCSDVQTTAVGVHERKISAKAKIGLIRCLIFLQKWIHQRDTSIHIFPSLHSEHDELTLASRLRYLQ